MFKDLLVEEKLNVKLCAKLYHNGNTALDEAFGIGTVNKYLNSLIKKIEQLKPDIPVRKTMTKLSKLSDSEVDAIRNLKDDGVPLQEIINKFNISFLNLKNFI